MQNQWEPGSCFPKYQNSPIWGAAIKTAEGLFTCHPIQPLPAALQGSQVPTAIDWVSTNIGCGWGVEDPALRDTQSWKLRLVLQQKRAGILSSAY